MNTKRNDNFWRLVHTKGCQRVGMGKMSQMVLMKIPPAKKNENSVNKKSQVKDFIGSNFGQQVALLALVTSLTTRWRDLY